MLSKWNWRHVQWRKTAIYLSDYEHQKKKKMQSFFDFAAYCILVKNKENITEI